MQTTAKHQPATPLPWEARPKQDGSFPIEDAEGSRFVRLHYATGVQAQHDAQRANAAYIAHACNAYPKLVEALRNALEVAEAYRANLHFDQTPREYDGRALLRELGEL